MKRFFIVAGLATSRPVNVFGNEVKLDMSWADGMIGCLPVFDSKENAEKYSEGKYKIYCIE